MTTPLGGEVGLTWDSSARIRPGDYLRSVSTGRTYLIRDVRTVTRGEHAGTRQRLRAVVVPEDHPEVGDVVFPIAWYPRQHRRR